MEGSTTQSRGGGSSRGRQYRRRRGGGNNKKDNDGSANQTSEGASRTINKSGGRGRGGRGGRGRKRGDKNASKDTSSVTPGASPAVIPAIEPAAPKHEAHLSNTTFASLEGISAASLRAIAEVLRFERLSLVQEATLPHILSGRDVLAKAKTGTGKTVGFLLPSIERLLKSKRNPRNISILAISPTRELASQIATEARQLCTYHDGVNVGVFVGGTNIKKDHKTLSGSIDILVATPGRLLDHLQNSNGFSDRLAAMSVLVLDEADQLLEQGFRIELEKILKYLPKDRQTLLFSATVPSELENFLRLSLKNDHQFIDTVGEEETQTNKQVEQSAMVCELDQHIAMIDVCLQRHIADCRAASQPFKVIVFFATARAAGYYATLFAHSGLEVVEMHSRKSQGYRTKASAKFRDHANLVMFSSDVSARGMDYGGVTLVLQVGLTDREQYIHRLGRTARAGLEGQGILLLSPFETCILRDLKDLPLQRVSNDQIQQWLEQPMREDLADSLAAVRTESELKLAAQQAYQAFLGYYNSNLKRIKWSKTELVAVANQYARIVGLASQPELLRRTVGKMGLKGVPGLKVK